MGKPNFGTELYKKVKKDGWQEENNTLYPPNSAKALKILQNGINVPSKKNKRLQGLKTGWIDDSRNIKNKEKQTDIFMRLVHQEMSIDVWPEFFFSTTRLYRFDYAIPINPNSGELKIAIEVDGGIHMKGNSGHSSGKGIARDMDKSTLANVNGWTLIRRTPEQLLTNETLELIKQAVDLLQKK